MGAWVGPEDIFWIFLYGALAGGALAFILLISPWGRQGVGGKSRRAESEFRAGRIPGLSAEGRRFSYTVPLAVGLIAFLVIGKTSA
jgi:hypothetical protein